VSDSAVRRASKNNPEMGCKRPVLVFSPSFPVMAQKTPTPGKRGVGANTKAGFSAGRLADLSHLPTSTRQPVISR
jgi:hypothetical protein